MAFTREREGYTHLYWYDETGTKKSQSLGKNVKKKDANFAVAQKITELADGTAILKDRLFVVFVKEYLEWYVYEYPSSAERTFGIVKNHLNPFLEGLHLSQIKIKNVDKYKVKRGKEGVKADTIIKELNVLNAILNKAVAWEEIKKNPITGYENPQILDSKPPRFYEKPELVSIYDESGERWNWCMFAANTGMRLGELFKARPTDISKRFRKVQIISEPNGRTKSAKHRTVPLNNKAMESLDGFYLGSEHLYEGINKKAASVWFRRMVEQASGVANPAGSIHCLRHSFATHLVRAGDPLPHVQKLLGHSSITTTEKYSHASPTDLKNGVMLIDL